MGKAKMFGGAGVIVGAAIIAALYVLKDNFLSWVWTQYLPVLGLTIALIAIIIGLLLLVYG